MKKALLGALLLSLPVVGIVSQKIDSSMPMSCRMIESEMVRFPNTWMLDFRNTPRWGYTNGLECHAILLVSQHYKEKEKEYVAYARGFADALVQEDGTIKNYSPKEYNIDHIAPGPMLLDLYDVTKEERFLKAAQLLRSQLIDHPRTDDGGFWHKKVYPNQMWLDGLYMAQPFYAEYAERFGDKDIYQDVIKQLTLVAKGTYDSKTGLYKHAFDYTKSAFWADKTNGQSKHVWGRAMGWYILAIVESLDYIPENEPNRKEVIKILNTIAKGLVKYQDKKTGLYYQVMELPGRKGNYLEGTCSSMFAYGILKAVRKGYLPKSYEKLGKSIYNGILKNLIKVDEQGVVSLSNCCAVAGLGPEKDKRRDGSFEYYLSEPIRDNDPKGVGTFILAALEIEMRK